MQSRNQVELIEECVACGSKELKLILDLGEQALANDFQSSFSEFDKYPLASNYCCQCSHIQLTHAVSPQILFSNYLYVSGTTQTLRDYFNFFAKKVTFLHEQESGESPDKTVIDIACNDGTQLDYFKRLGWKTMGIDPAENLFPISSKNHFIICDFLKEHHGDFLKADFLIAQNVLAHTRNPLAFLKIASRIADTILIQTSQAFMVERNEFDTTYHEHISYFSELSMFRLAERAGLSIANIEVMDVHGDSFLFTLKKRGKSISPPPPLPIKMAEHFAENAKKILNDLTGVIEHHKNQKRTVVGYGAAAKGMTVLNALESRIDFLVDDSSLKIGKLSPGKGYQVESIEALKKVKNPLTIVLLAWNFEAEIRDKIKQLNLSDVEYVTYFPTVKVSK